MSFFRKLFGSKKDKSKQIDGDTNHHEENQDKKIPFDFDNYLNSKLVRLESAFRYQPYDFRRATEDNRITLGEVLNELGLLKKDEICSLVVITRHVFLKASSDERIDDVDEIYSYDLFKGFQHGVKDGHYTEGGSYSYALILFAKDKNIYINLTALGGPICLKYIRVSLCIPDNRIQDDDLRSFQGEHNPVVTSFVLSFAEEGYEEELKYFDSVEQSATLKQQRGEEFNEIEQEYIHGKFEFNGYNYIGYGKWLSEQSRYYDAVTILTRAFNFMKTSVHRYDENLRNAFYVVCSLLAQNYLELNQGEKALYFSYISSKYANTLEPAYLEMNILSSLGNSIAMQRADSLQNFIYRNKYGEDQSKWPKENLEIHQIIAKLLELYKRDFDERVKQNPTINGIITIGDLLKVLLGVQQINILPQMAIIDNKSHNVDKIIESDNIYGYVLNEKSNQNKTFVLTLSHSHGYTGSKDHSKLCSSATLLIATHGVKQADDIELMRVDVMRTNSVTNDDKQSLELQDNRPFNASVILGFASDDTFGTSKEECIKCSAYAGILKNQWRFIEAAKFYKWTFDHANNLLKNDKGLYRDIDEEILDLCFDSAYNLGFSLMEIAQFETAFYYLKIAKDSNNIGCVIEYINCLSNSKSPLVLEEINELIALQYSPQNQEDKEGWEHFQAFLKRRKAYTLIDLQEYDEAKSFLASIKDDPRCRDFALNEINYLNSIGH